MHNLIHCPHVKCHLLIRNMTADISARVRWVNSKTYIEQQKHRHLPLNPNMDNANSWIIQSLVHGNDISIPTMRFCKHILNSKFAYFERFLLGLVVRIKQDPPVLGHEASGSALILNPENWSGLALDWMPCPDSETGSMTSIRLRVLWLPACKKGWNVQWGIDEYAYSIPRPYATVVL